MLLMLIKLQLQRNASPIRLAEHKHLSLVFW
jgi:hypothetical protein